MPHCTETYPYINEYTLMRLMPAVLPIALAGLLSVPAPAQVSFRTPQPGDVYREFSRVMSPGGSSWRVTDPNIDLNRYPQAGDFLPNPTLAFTIDDLQGALRAEAVMTVWGGHVGTTGKEVRFNGNSWITIPELDQTNGIPGGSSGQCYTQQLNVVVEVPLGHLVEGSNTFQGTSGGQTCYDFGWGQWGWYALMIRVYYDPATKPHPTGTITTPSEYALLDENPVLSASVSPDVDRVEFLASYDGYDTDGDGGFGGFHHDYHIGPSESSMEIKNHVGTATAAPFQVSWNTDWVPDQVAGGITLLARLRGAGGVWYVTDAVEHLSLRRVGRSVRLYKPEGYPEDAWTNAYHSSIVTRASIPSGTVLGDATGARYYIRTWNGLDSEREPGESHFRRLNGWYDGEFGGNHIYSYDIRAVPVNALQVGSNEFEFMSETTHHGIEMLFPGPALSVTYQGSYASPVPLQVSLEVPADAATGIDPNPSLAWLPTPGAETYHLQVARDAGFSDLVVNDSLIADTSRQIGPLSGVTTYYWRVRGKGPAGYGPLSVSRSFTTRSTAPLAAPVLVSPVNNAASLPTSVALLWRKAEGASEYHLQVSTDSSFATGMVVNDSTVTDTTRTVAGLAHDVRYHWRVRSKNASETSPYSSRWAFTTIVPLPGTPTLVLPADGAVVSRPVIVTWNPAAYAATYHLQVATDSTFTSGVVTNDSTIASASRELTALAPETRYHWRVRAKNLAGNGSFSQRRTFTTAPAGPPAPGLVAPLNGAVSQAVSGLEFRWHSVAGATGYRYQLATDPTFTSGIVKNDSSLTDTLRIVNGLAAATTYHWRVSGRVGSVEGDFSPAWSFTTVTPLPSTVTLLSPPEGSTINADSVLLRWSQSSPAVDRYKIEMAADPQFMFAVSDSTFGDTTHIFRGLIGNQTYYWRVRAHNAGGWGSMSAVSHFIVGVTEVRPGSGLPDAYTLSQNYPNPFNPTTQITFGVPREGAVRLDVFDVNGERVATLVEGRVAAGYYSVEFDGARLSSGIYYYRLLAEGAVESRKMLLIK